MGGDLTGTASNAQIAAGAILNADVNASAAIAYSKLNLGTSIVNADVNASAAIAYSKLALATSIVNADIAAAAAIAESKLSISAKIPEPYLTETGVIISGNAVTLNHIRGVRYRWPKTGTVTGLALYLVATSGNYIVGVYDTSATNLNLLAGSATTAAGTINTWQGVDFTAGLPVTGGGDAFLVVHTDNSTVSFGRTGAHVSVNINQFPAGYIAAADASLMRCWDFNRGSYSAPLPSQISVASLAVNAGMVFAVKYA